MSLWQCLRHFGVVTIGRGAAGIQCCEARGAAKHPHDSYAARNVNSAQAEKPFEGPFSVFP